MDIDFRWGGDPSIILGIEAAMVASIPIQVSKMNQFFIFWFNIILVSSFIITLVLCVLPPVYSILCAYWLQLKDLQVFTVIRVIFQLTDEIPCISAVVVALLSEVHLSNNNTVIGYSSLYYQFLYFLCTSMQQRQRDSLFLIKSCFIGYYNL